MAKRLLCRFNGTALRSGAQVRERCAGDTVGTGQLRTATGGSTQQGVRICFWVMPS